MTAGFSTQAFQDLLQFPFRTPGGKTKMLIAGLLVLANFLIPFVPGLFLIGYGGLIMREIIVEKRHPDLPDWNDLGGMFVLGAKLGAAGLIYSLPALAILLASYFGMMAPAFLAPFAPAASNQELGRWFGLSMLSMFGGMFGIGIGIVLALATFFVFVPAMGHIVATNSFQAGFRVREWWQVLRANFGGFVVAIILTGGLYMVVLFLMQALYMTIVLCLAIPLLLAAVSAYVLPIFYALMGYAYAEGAQKLEARSSLPPGPTEAPAAS